MTNKSFANLLVPVLFVIFLYLAAGVAIAHDIHGFDQPLTNQCSICVASQVMSFLEHSSHDLPVCVDGFTITPYLPTEESSYPIPTCINHFANRAPPKYFP